MPGALWRSRARVALPRALSRATKTIRAPILASSIAATSPIPDVPPVITTVFPLISISVITSLSQGCCLKTAVLPEMPNIPQGVSDRFGQVTKIDPHIACRRAGEVFSADLLTLLRQIWVDPVRVKGLRVAPFNFSSLWI